MARIPDSEVHSGYLSDVEILDYIERGMITNAHLSKITQVDGVKIASKGISSAGYDVTLGTTFRVLPGISSYLPAPNRNVSKAPIRNSRDEWRHIVAHRPELIVDYKNPEALERQYLHDEGEIGKPFIVYPGDLVLGTTVEEFNIPPDILVTCHMKSTLARAGIVVKTTLIEPGMKGQITLEIYASVNLPTKIYPGEGIAQFTFSKLANAPRLSYADRAGKYMNQQGVTLPKV